MIEKNKYQSFDDVEIGKKFYAVMGDKIEEMTMISKISDRIANFEYSNGGESPFYFRVFMGLFSETIEDAKLDLDLRFFRERFEKLQSRLCAYNIYDENEEKHRRNMYSFLMGMDECFYMINSFVKKFGFNEFTVKSVNICFDRFFCIYDFKNIEKIKMTNDTILFYTKKGIDSGNVYVDLRMRLKRYFDVLKKVENEQVDIDKLITDMEIERKEEIDKFKENLKKEEIMPI